MTLQQLLFFNIILTKKGERLGLLAPLLLFCPRLWWFTILGEPNRFSWLGWPEVVATIVGSHHCYWAVYALHCFFCRAYHLPLSIKNVCLRWGGFSCVDYSAAISSDRHEHDRADHGDHARLWADRVIDFDECWGVILDHRLSSLEFYPTHFYISEYHWTMDLGLWLRSNCVSYFPYPISHLLSLVIFTLT